jgi:antitoxin component YwqK of YwqJK toxin-antitoxin module
LFNSKTEEFQAWHEDGTLKTEGKLNHSKKKQGQWKEYYQNGKLKSDKSFKYDELYGFCSEYYDNGQVKSSRKYGYNKSKEGTWKTFSKTGVLTSNEVYSFGKLEGKSITYYDSGKEHVITTYDDGVKEGLYAVKSETGAILEYGTHDYKGEKTGVWVKNFPSGEMKEKRTYKSGALSGMMEDYSSPKVLLKKYSINNGVVVGNSQTFHPDGSLHISENFNAGGKPNGLYERFNKEGKTIEKGNYENGKKIKKWFVIGPDGKKKKTKY